jgi:hypothetical protein
MYNTLQLLLTFLSLLVRRTARSLVRRGRPSLSIASVQMRGGYLSCISFWRQWVCSGRQAFEVLSVVFVGLSFPVSKSTITHSSGAKHTKGRPQYVHQQICGLSVLIKILGCPNGPPPPSQETTRFSVHVTGCWWIRSMAAYGRG